MKIDKRNPRHWFLLLQQGINTLIAVIGRHVLPKPRKPVVVLYGHQLSGNLRALLHAWQLGYTDRFDCYFLSLDPDYSRQLRQQGLPVLRCSNIHDMLLAGRCAAMITDHGLHAMSPFIALTNIRFIDVWHGIPFKGFTPDDFRVQRRYDEVWVSSPLLKSIYEEKFGFRPDIVRDMGYARADRLFLRQSPGLGFRSQAAIPATRRIVLYAPTWKQDNDRREMFPFGASQQAFVQMLAETCENHGATLVIRSHLNASIGMNTLDNVRYCSMHDYPDTEELLLNSDILICDWSSIAFDYLALERPTIFLDVEPPFMNGFTLGPEFRYGKIARDLPSLGNLLAGALANPQAFMGDELDRYHKIRAGIYGSNVDGHVAERQLNRLLELVDRS